MDVISSLDLQERSSLSVQFQGNSRQNVKHRVTYLRWKRKNENQKYSLPLVEYILFYVFVYSYRYITFCILFVNPRNLPRNVNQCSSAVYLRKKHLIMLIWLDAKLIFANSAFPRPLINTVGFPERHVPKT